jgi:hypothetical protein
MTGQSEVESLKRSLYVDKVYSGVSEIRRRLAEDTRSDVDLNTSELRIFSQNGEDGILIEILRNLPSKNNFFVEFGVGDGWSCNTRVLAEVLAWSGVYLEVDTSAFQDLNARYMNCDRVLTLCEQVTPNNINAIFDSAGVPERFGVLSIDIDGQDYWVWDAIDSKYKPDVVIAEVNLNFGNELAVSESLGVQQSPLTETFGASIGAMRKLANEKGYELVHVEMAGVNAFFVLREHLQAISFKGLLDRSPNYGLRGKFHDQERLYQGHPRVPRSTTNV